MNKQETLIRKRNAVTVDLPKNPRKASEQDICALTMQAEVMRLGFIFDKELLLEISRMTRTAVRSLYEEAIPILRKMVGDDVEWEPFYPNFPQSVIDASDTELFANAMMHYWTGGHWTPLIEKETRLPALEDIEYKILTLAGPDDEIAIFTEILGANGSVSISDSTIMRTIMMNLGEDKIKEGIPENIPFKENLCWFVGECIARNWHLVGMQAMKTATDILRVATSLSSGDISLAVNTKFISFKRPLRRAFIWRLESVINQDDIFRHRNKWIRLAHSLHVGDFAKMCPKVWKIFEDARSSNSTYKTFNAKVEVAVRDSKFSNKDLIALLQTRPGVFARRLDHAYRLSSKAGAKTILKGFADVADKVDTRVLLQLHGHFNARDKPVKARLVLPKGGEGKSRMLTQELPALSRDLIEDTQLAITDTLHERFSHLDPLGDTAYIDPALKECPIPLSLRSASDSLVTVARGTKIPFLGDAGTIRMFVYWKGQDIDLSAFFVDEGFTKQDSVSYMDLRTDFAVHSGDFVDAQYGATEFIDVDIDKTLASGYRYAVMSVLVFSGPTFKEHKICYAGWMTRSKPSCNEIFEPKTVKQKMNLTCKSKKVIPVIFDLKERKAIWLDLSTGRGSDNLMVPNNVNTNKASLYDAVTAGMNLENKPTLFDLFDLHARARCKWITEDPEDADIKFGWDGDVKPTDTTAILSEYL